MKNLNRCRCIFYVNFESDKNIGKNVWYLYLGWKNEFLILFIFLPFLGRVFLKKWDLLIFHIWTDAWLACYLTHTCVAGHQTTVNNMQTLPTISQNFFGVQRATNCKRKFCHYPHVSSSSHQPFCWLWHLKS